MKPDKSIFGELLDRSCDVREEISGSEQSREARVEAGDLFLLRMPSPVPVTWCAVFSHSQDRDLWYCVPGDSFSLVSSADVSSPSSPVRGVLHFRCQCGLWVHAEDIDLANRYDRLTSDGIVAIRAVISDLSANPIAFFVDDESASDPDYIEWIDTLRDAVNVLLDSLHNEQIHVVRMIGRESAISHLGQHFSLAADDSVTSASDTATPSLLQRLQVSDSAHGSLHACLYEDGVVIEWHPVEIDSDLPVVVYDTTTMRWVSQEAFWCTELVPWSDDRVEISVNGEIVGFVKPQV